MTNRFIFSKIGPRFLQGAGSIDLIHRSNILSPHFVDDVGTIGLVTLFLRFEKPQLPSLAKLQ